ncbi:MULTISPECIES: hypothetical protein [unclassified Tolypothrix]|uniref:hypothetical protein n=1 Tax=unclassified Tolypothrix TaxID=2649714 RepID=UPI0005EAA364|nr:MULTISPECIES: hypothetical protein [unclassified Tolypothrix]BAY92266.1 hypothetical protein NIES3275_43000 [Microchaete diplosiphon NIES-3275]EKE98443.1 hypothetical protein FDUTEX481_03977 [Tolypothrix sp. PCC 7601]MBE9087432.1 hypothetical protein [Tolypothrix sp. LEGE 11397]UYD26240.1 hypothetical protein HGR01_33950 [Tolypothrix sp. PCC 7712]UYD31522.1 hypothetical protein HG267_20555 [Tolypothrix sp. PCC 7601]
MSAQSAHTLDLNILLEKDTTGKETAIVLEIPDCRITADTRQQALDGVRQLLSERLAKAEIVSLKMQLPENPHPWMKFAGMFQDEPLFAEITKEIREERQETAQESSPNTL